MHGGIERIGGCAGGREQGGGRGRAPAVPGTVVAEPARAQASQAQEAAVFEPIADLLDDVARLADGRDDPGAVRPDAVAARIRQQTDIALGAQARLGEAGVRALLGAIREADDAAARTRLP